MYLICYINEKLGIVPSEVPDYISLSAVREDPRDQRDALFRGEGMADQPFPSWSVRAICGQSKGWSSCDVCTHLAYFPRQFDLAAPAHPAIISEPRSVRRGGDYVIP